MGDRGDYILSSRHFDIFLYHMMKDIKEVDQVMEVNDQTSLELRYAEDVMLISYLFDRLKKSTRYLKEANKKWNL